MKICKFQKKKNGLYEIQLESSEKLVLYEDVILKFNLLFSKEINDSDKSFIMEANKEYDAYYVAVKLLKSRFKSVKEVKDYLLKKEYPLEYTEKAVNKLIEQGYLNDRSFAKAYINEQILTNCNGPKKIEYALLSKGIDNQIIADELDIFDIETQKQKIEKIALRMIKNNRNCGNLVLKKKIINNLCNLGYEISIINLVINKLDFNPSFEIQKKEYDKLYHKLSKKYSGKQLELKIKEKLYQKGLYYEN